MITYSNSSEGATLEWPEDTFITDEVLENLKEAAESGCVLCEMDELDEED